MKKNGFTLIELLAIIVILAIIAVITVPIIMNIIENSRKGAAQDSAYGYVDAVEKYYASQLFDSQNVKLQGEYSVTEGVIDGYTLNNKEVPIDGTIPTSGNLVYSENILTGGCLIVNEYAIVFRKGNVISTEKGNCEGYYSKLTNEIETTEKTDNHEYINNEFVVYYNPTIGELCDASKAVSTTGTTTGCLKWYAYSIKDGVVNMILDHNINPVGSGVAWISNSDYDNATSIAPGLGVTNIGTGSYGEHGNNNKGPLTALSYLRNATASWATSVIGDYKTYTASITNANYTINYEGYKARFLTEGEARNLGQCDTSGDSCPDWLNINTSSATGEWGYWLSDGTSEFTGSSVTTLHNLGAYNVNDTERGVRPVITLPVTEIFS